MRGLCPRAPGIYRFPARMAAGRGGFAPPAIPALDRRSGRVPALPYPPSRPRQYTPPSGSIVKNVCRNVHRWVINTLVLVQFRWPVLKCPRMAGFQVSTEARMKSGTPRPLQRSTDSWAELLKTRSDPEPRFWTTPIDGLSVLALTSTRIWKSAISGRADTGRLRNLKNCANDSSAKRSPMTSSSRSSNKPSETNSFKPIAVFADRFLRRSKKS